MGKTTDRFRMTEELGQRLQSLRKRAGPTQKELADALEKYGDRDLGRKFAALALDGIDRQLRRK